MSLANCTPLKYRAEIDGLRAIAVLAVLLFHSDIGFHGGYVGVDVFFVISGYLITGLILKDLDSGRFQILEFWERRIRRILPVLAVVVFSCLVAGWFLFFPLDFKKLGLSAVAQAMLLSNVYFWRNSGYFDQVAEVKPLLHCWSLAVEEQFYLLFPLLLITFKRFSRKTLVPGILLLLGCSFSLSVYWSYWHHSVNFFFLPPRAWELLIGAFLAVIPRQRLATRWVMELLSWGGLVAILYAIFFYDNKTRFPGVAALPPCVGTALLIWANGQILTSLGKILATRPVVFVGLISYSLYLWHWPVFVFAKYNSTHGPFTPSQRMLLLLVSVALAVLTWRFVESPFRKRIVLKSRAQVFTFAAITTTMMLLAGLAIYKLQGVPSRIPAEVLRYASGATDRSFGKDLGLKEVLAGNFIELGSGEKKLPIDLLVWGDSHAMSAMPIFDMLCKENSIHGVAVGHSSRPPLIGFVSRADWNTKETIVYNKAVVEFIRIMRIRDVILIAVWGNYASIDGTKRVHQGLLDTLNALKDSGARIWIMREVPRHTWNVPLTLAYGVWNGKDPEEFGLSLAEHRERYKCQDPIFERLETNFPGVTVLDPTEFFVSNRRLCRAAKDGKSLYCDASHLSDAGAMLLRPLFEPIFERMGKSLSTGENQP